MAFYKQDIVDINLNTGSIFRSFLAHSIGFKNDDADRFGIRCFRDGEPVDLSGASCQAVFMAPNGVNIALTSYGTVSGNVAYVTLPPACYDYEGQFCLSIQLVGGGVTSTMRIVDGMVVNTGASGAVAPTASVPTYQEIIAQYDAMVAATSAANLAIAEEFDASKNYPAGKNVINDGALYVLPNGHTAGTTWANTTKVASNLGDQVSELKSAMVQLFADTVGVEQGYWAIANGAPVSSNTWCRTTGYVSKYSIFDVPSPYSMFLIAYNKNTDAYVGTWNGTAFSTTYTASGKLSHIDVRQWMENYPNYIFKIDFFKDDAAFVPSDVLSVITVTDEITERVQKIEELFSTNVSFVDGYGVNYLNGTLPADTTYSYCELTVAAYAGGRITGESYASDDKGIAFYDASGEYISGFGNPVSGRYKWVVDGVIPSNAITAKIHCKKEYQSNFSIAFSYDHILANLSAVMASEVGIIDSIAILNKKTYDKIFPVLRNGSQGNPGNGNSVSCNYIIPIDFNYDYIDVYFVGDLSLANKYDFSYCLYHNATDGMTTSEAFASSSVTKRNVNPDAEMMSGKPFRRYATKDFAGYEHISFTAWRKMNSTYVPIRIATDQYSIECIYSIAQELSTDVQTKLNNARHIKGDTGTPLTILHFSDIHEDLSALSRIVYEAEKFTGIDEMICTGDIVANTAEQISSWWDQRILTCIGNHETASYSPETGYNWTALSMANRDAYYIAPFESGWGITHTTGKSYYYKDYSTQKVRMIVMDAMLYTDNGQEATDQTTWLTGLLSSAITNNLHVLIAIHAPHGGATAKECSFSRYGQAEMPTYSDCNTPQTVIDAVALAIANGLHFIGYIVGHTHQDNIWDAEGSGKQLMYCVTCANVSYKPQWVNSDQDRSNTEDAYNLITIDTANTLVKIVRGGGADIDDHMRTRKAICFDYSTGLKVGEVL